jgi:hypothetical protein
VRKKKRKGEGERLTGGVAVSARANKIKRERERERERERDGPARGELGGPAGLAGPKGERVRFSLFSFSNSFLKQPFFSNSNQTLSNFSQKYINLFRNHTSNQKPCKPTDDAQSLVVSKFIKLCLIF